MNHFNFTSLFLLLSVLFVSNAYFIPFSNSLQKGDWDGANWMKNALPIIGNLTLQQITIPGSHDTGTYNLTDYLIELPDYIVELVELADELDIPVIEIFKAWAKTQDKNYTEQFEAGIRYMDIRVCYDLGQWRNHHGCVRKKIKKNYFPIFFLFFKIYIFKSWFAFARTLGPNKRFFGYS